MPIVSELSERIKAHGFEQFGFVSIDRPMPLALYRDWLSDGCHGDMSYLEDHLPIKENPQILMANARTAIVLGAPYYPAKPQTHPLSGPRTALYAQSADYHFWLLEKVEKLREALVSEFLDDQFLCYTDSKPVAERDLAARAGLGWIGKNGCLIDRTHGSLFFLAEISTTLSVETPERLVPDHCGTCDRCIKACPTQALRPDRTLDARKCVAYWTIEAKTHAPENLRPDFSDWFFGCDICQTVCPWNEKVFGKEAMRSLTGPQVSADLEPSLRWCLTASNREIEKELRGSPLLRAGPRGLKRNALIVIANLKLHSLKPEVEAVSKKLLNLRPLAVWTLNQLDKD